MFRNMAAGSLGAAKVYRIVGLCKRKIQCGVLMQQQGDMQLVPAI